MLNNIASNAPLPSPSRAFVTDDSIAVLRFAVEALTAGKEAVLVTLTDIEGGAARALGSQMCVRDDGHYCGFVSGGCVESAVAFEALDLLARGQDRQIRYGKGSPWFDIVLPCGGGITLTLHRLRSARPLLAVLNSLERRTPAGLHYCPATQQLDAIEGAVTTGWRSGGFERGYRPRVQLVLQGHSVEAQATAALAQAAGYEVTGFTDASDPLIDADTAVVLLWHDLHRELPVLQAALRARPFYIGALGSQRTHSQRSETLLALGWHQEDIARIKAPIGLFPRARDASTLALSVLADIAATRQAGAAS